MSVIHFALPLLIPSVLGAAGVISGNVMMDHAQRQPSGSEETAATGLLIFVLGWLVIIMILSMRLEVIPNQDCLQLRLNLQNFLLAGLPAFVVMGASLYSHFLAPNPDAQQISFYVFSAAWIVLAIGISVRNGNFHQHALAFALPSALAIIASMNYLMKSTGTDMSAFTYAPGVPLFVLGWLGTAFAIAATRHCELCGKKK